MIRPSRAALLELYAKLKRPIPPRPVTSTSSTRSSPLTPFADIESQFFSSASPSPLPSFSSVSFTDAPPSPLLLSSLRSSASSLTPSPHRTVLSLDVGARQVGLALSDPSLTLASPLPPLLRGPTRSLLPSLSSLLATHHTAALLVGLPLSNDGRLTPQALSIQAFVAPLYTALPSPRPALLWWDESFSSRLSRDALREAGVDVRRAKESGLVDGGAAAVILHSFLEHLHGVVDSERTRLRRARVEEKRAKA